MLSTQDYEAFSHYLEQSCGIVLGANKQYLVTSRLASLLEDYSLPSYAELIKLIVEGGRSDLTSKAVDAMTTNETSWFRDRFPFEILKQHILPEMLEAGRRRITLWSAACSTGQEPYSVSMTIAEFFDAQPKCFLNPKIIATDISPSVLNEARKGVYEPALLERGLSPVQRRRFFTPRQDGCAVNSDIKSRVSFQLLNLKSSYSILGKLDVIFCRNVLIYFSSELRDAIIDRMIASLNPSGYLYLGASESLGRNARFFQTVRCHGGLVYRLK